MKLTPGQIIFGRFIVEDLLDEGSMGQVWRGRHVKLNMPVALKTMRHTNNDALLRRFEREAQLMARINHANVVRILDYGVLEPPRGVVVSEDAMPTPCIVMEFIHGVPLTERLAQSGALPWSDAVKLILQVIGGLRTMHDAGILHRDLKPSNVLLTHDAMERVKLVDLGIAKSLADADMQLTAPGVLIGTPAYMAPEQLMGESIDTRSEQYSVALILYELLSGVLPFGGGRPTAVMRRLRYDVPIPELPPHLPKPPDVLMRVLACALARRPEDRYSSLAEFTSHLEHIMDGSHPGILNPLALDSEVSEVFQEYDDFADDSLTQLSTPTTLSEASSEGGTLRLIRPTSRQWARQPNDAPSGLRSLDAVPTAADAPSLADELTESELPPERFLTRGVLVARLPASKMLQYTERDELSSILPEYTRAFFYRDYNWVVLFGKTPFEVELEIVMQAIESYVLSRFPERARVKTNLLREPMYVLLDAEVSQEPPALLRFMIEEMDQH